MGTTSEHKGQRNCKRREQTLIWASFTSVGRLDTIIFSPAWGGAGVGLPVPGVVVEYLARAETAGSFFPGTSARPTPRRLPGFLVLGREAIIFEGETMSHFTSWTSGKKTNIIEGLVHDGN